MKRPLGHCNLVIMINLFIKTLVVDKIVICGYIICTSNRTHAISFKYTRSRCYVRALPLLLICCCWFFFRFYLFLCRYFPAIGPAICIIYTTVHIMHGSVWIFRKQKPSMGTKSIQFTIMYGSFIPIAFTHWFLPSSGGAKFNSCPFVRTIIFKITPLYDEILKIAGRPSTRHERKHPTDQFMQNHFNLPDRGALISGRHFFP